jgi:hypothetical protein
MGQDVTNAGIQGHATGFPPVAQLELWHHFGDKGLDDATALTQQQAETLIAATGSQAAFDVVAGALAPWYAFPTLTPAERTAARAATRMGVAVFAGLQT